MRTQVTEVIAVNKEAYLFLERISRQQRGCKPLTEAQEDRFWDRCCKNKEGLKELDNDSIGGGDGNYYGKWWSWSVRQLRNMLSEAGFTWKECGTREYINL